MPPKQKFTRESVLNAAFELVRAQGMEALNSRALAGAVGCSTRPIFRLFSSMEELRGEVRKRAQEVYDDYIARSSELSDKPYLGTGLAYILFAKDDPHLFRAVFADNRRSRGVTGAFEDKHDDYVLQAVAAATGLSLEDAARYHQQIWLFTHGLVMAELSGFASYTQEQIIDLLSVQFQAVRMYFVSKNDEKVT